MPRDRGLREDDPTRSSMGILPGSLATSYFVGREKFTLFDTRHASMLTIELVPNTKALKNRSLFALSGSQPREEGNDCVETEKKNYAG
eukprot:scaffold142658_cov15-Tisochrysis_lutea.AAC.1